MRDELRNPLQIAQMYHLQEQPANDAAAEQVQDATDRIEEMIDILLVTVRESDVTIDDEPVVIADFATEAWTDLSVDTEAAVLQVEAQYVILADPVHIEHLLRNLYRNSLEHGDPDVMIRVADVGDGFYVADDGPGIDADIRADVTEAGFTTKADGIGLGLTFVKHLAETDDWQWTIMESAASGARCEFTDVDTVSVAEDHQH